MSKLTPYIRLFVPKEKSLLNEEVTQLTPWHINYLGGEWHKATQCYGGGDNSWARSSDPINIACSNQHLGSWPYLFQRWVVEQVGFYQYPI
jgi:hypothetical protein